MSPPDWTSISVLNDRGFGWSSLSGDDRMEAYLTGHFGAQGGRQDCFALAATSVVVRIRVVRRGVLNTLSGGRFGGYQVGTDWHPRGCLLRQAITTMAGWLRTFNISEPKSFGIEVKGCSVLGRSSQTTSVGWVDEIGNG